MTTIRCWDYACVFNSAGTCSADAMEYHPDHGCLTMEEREDYEPEEEWTEPFEEEEWEEEELEGEWEEEELLDEDWEDDEF